MYELESIENGKGFLNSLAYYLRETHHTVFQSSSEEESQNTAKETSFTTSFKGL